MAPSIEESKKTNFTFVIYSPFTSPERAKIGSVYFKTVGPTEIVKIKKEKQNIEHGALYVVM